MFTWEGKPIPMVEQFGKYILLERLASGGMAEVYLAKTIGANGINKFLAIKRILQQYSDNTEFIEMFKQEAKIAVNLNHSNVVSIYDFGIEHGQFFLVMEFVEGQNLRQILNHMKKESKEFSIDQIVYVAKEVAAGLDHAHRCLDSSSGTPLNITHRDMSPQNIMLSFEGEVKVVDFGIAKAEDQIEHTRAGTIKGKFGYMSPEQAEGQVVNNQTDIFSLGIVLWELLAKERLFVAQSEAATLKRVRDCQIPSLRKINPNIPPELERICNKALAKDKALRYHSAAALHKDLNRFLNLQYPEFSSQDFSKFMKSLFNRMYVENRKKFSEFAKIVVEDDKTAVTQTSTLTLTATDTAPRTETHSTPSASSQPQANPSVSAAQPIIGIPNAPRTTVLAPQEDGEEQKHLAIDVQTSSKVDLSQLRREGEKSRVNGPRSNTTTGVRSATQSGMMPISGTESRISPRGFEPPRRSISPVLAGVGLLVVAVVSYIVIQGPKNVFDSQTVNRVSTILHPPPSGSNDESSRAPTPNPTNGTSASVAGQNQVPATNPAKPNPTETKEPQFTEQVPLAIHSQPSGARVYINDQNRGLTPYRGWVELNKPFRVALVKDEYLPYDRGEMKATTSEGVTIRATLQPEPPTGYISIDVINGGSEPVISVNGARLGEKPPVGRYPVPAGVPVKVRVYNPVNQLYAEETVIVGVGQKRAIRLFLGRTGQSQ